MFLAQYSYSYTKISSYGYWHNVNNIRRRIQVQITVDLVRQACFICFYAPTISAQCSHKVLQLVCRVVLFCLDICVHTVEQRVADLLIVLFEIGSDRISKFVCVDAVKSDLIDVRIDSGEVACGKCLRIAVQLHGNSQTVCISRVEAVIHRHTVRQCKSNGNPVGVCRCCTVKACAISGEFCKGSADRINDIVTGGNIRTCIIPHILLCSGAIYEQRCHKRTELRGSIAVLQAVDTVLVQTPRLKP